MRISSLPALALLLAGVALGAAGTVPETPADLDKPPAAAETTGSGLASLILAPGQGQEHPGGQDYVTMHYSIWTHEGHLVDSTLERAEPVTLPMDRLMKGMTEGLLLMVPGQRRRFWIPAGLGFPAGKGLPVGALVMDLQLISIDPPPSRPPADLLAPAADAMVGSSGLVYRVLRHGTGTQHPGGRDTVTVQYTGWTQDGKVFDSTLQKRSTLTIRLDEVIKGWRQGLKLMVPGDKMRFWIPEKLAYQGKEGMPAGTLVFDVELLKIWP